MTPIWRFCYDDLYCFTLDKNGQVIFFCERPPSGNPAYAHVCSQTLTKQSGSTNLSTQHTDPKELRTFNLFNCKSLKGNTLMGTIRLIFKNAHKRDLFRPREIEKWHKNTSQTFKRVYHLRQVLWVEDVTNLTAV